MDHFEQHAQGTTSPIPEKYAKTATSLVQDSGLSRQVTYEEGIPKVHSKTFLAIFAVSTMYFAQVYCLAGAGAVSTSDLAIHPHLEKNNYGSAQSQF